MVLKEFYFNIGTKNYCIYEYNFK